MAGKVLEITLKSLTVQRNGEITRPEGRNLLTATLIYPGPGKPTVTTVKPLQLGEGTTVDFDAAPYTYADRILFKEEVIGPTLLVAHLTDVEVPTKVTKFMVGMFSTVFTAAWGLAAPAGDEPDPGGRHALGRRPAPRYAAGGRRAALRDRPGLAADRSRPGRSPRGPCR